MLVKSAAGFPHETGGTQRIPALPNTTKTGNSSAFGAGGIGPDRILPAHENDD